MTSVDNRNALQDVALRALRNGISMLPIDRTTKRPYTKFLPLDEAGKPTWKPFQSAHPTEADVIRWIKGGAQIAFVGGAISGGLECIDHDDVQGVLQRDEWLVLCDGFLDGVAVQQTGGGGYQYIYRYETTEPRDGNLKLAFLPDDDNDSGRSVSIETRGEGGYFVIAPSFHPSGNQYLSLENDLASPPILKKPRRDFIITQARACDKAPQTRQQIEKEQSAIRATAITRSHGSSSVGGDSVIDAYNARVHIEDALRSAGYYAGHNDRFVYPGGSRSDSVYIENNRSFHHSSNDPKNDGYWHTPFDFHLADCGDDLREAVKSAAVECGMEHKSTVTDLPLGEKNGKPVCPICGSTKVYRSKHPFPGTETPGWYCYDCYKRTNGASRWPVEAYTPVMNTKNTTIHTHKPVDTTDSVSVNPPATGYRWNFCTRSDLMAQPVPIDLVSGMFPTRSVVMLYSEYGAGKSVLAADLAMAVAQHHNVLYIAAEAFYIYKARVRGWELHHNMTTERLHWIDNAVNIGSDTEIDQVIGIAKSKNFALIVIDTYSASTNAFGMDENSQGDSERAAHQIKRIRDETGATVLVVHHEGKASNGPRGGTPFPAACDVIYHLQNRDDVLSLECTKQRLGRVPEKRHFRIIEKDTDLTDDDGKVITSPILIPTNRIDMRNAKPDERANELLEELCSVMWPDGARKIDLANSTGLDSTQVSRSLERLVLTGYVKQEKNTFTPTDMGRAYNTRVMSKIVGPGGDDDADYTANWAVRAVLPVYVQPEAPVATFTPVEETETVTTDGLDFFDGTEEFIFDEAEYQCQNLATTTTECVADTTTETVDDTTEDSIDNTIEVSEVYTLPDSPTEAQVDQADRDALVDWLTRNDMDVSETDPTDILRQFVKMVIG